MKTKLNILMVIALAAALVGGNTGLAQAAPPLYEAKDSIDVTPASPTLAAVDPMAWGISGDVLPARPFLYSVDEDGITITRFNDNQVVGTWPWPADVIYTVLPDGSFTGLTPPAVWEPVAMTVSYPTEGELANRVKEIPDLTPPPTFVYVVMAHSGYEWESNFGFRDTIVESTNPDMESAMLIQIDVSDPSFSTSRDPIDPSGPHIAAAILGHEAGQPVYDRSNGNVYVGNLPSTSLPAGLREFVSVIRRIPPEVAAEEPEIPGISKPVIRCGPQHPETGIPVDSRKHSPVTTRQACTRSMTTSMLERTVSLSGSSGTCRTG